MDPVDEECVIIGEPEINHLPLTDCEPYTGGWKNKETNCWEGEYLSDDSDIVSCKNVDPEGNRAEITEEDGDILYCDSVDSMNYGDPWCPVNYVYEDGFCQKQTAICDQGFNGNYMVGCNNIYTPDDDQFFEEYQDECVFETGSVPPSINAYDEICCYSSTFNGYELYEKDRTEEYIKIY